MYRKVIGRQPLDLASTLNDLALAFPGRPHDPLADARAAAALVCRLAECASKEGEEPIQLSQSVAFGGPTRRRPLR
jgi:hypothetical protein